MPRYRSMANAGSGYQRLSNRECPQAVASLSPPPTMTAIASLPFRYPSRVYLTLAPVLALGALSPTPSLPPLVFLLAVLRLHAFTIVPRRKCMSGIAQVALVSLAIAIVHAGPSTQALSTPSTSLIVLAMISCLTTAITAATLVASFCAERTVHTGWTHTTIFPAIWASAWAAVEYLSPIGQLTTWSPVVELGGYAWLRPYGGQVAINWVVAAWAVVLADAAGAWMMGSDGYQHLAPENPSLISFEDDHIPVATAPTHADPPSQKARPTLVLAGLLLALAAPSYFIASMPPPVSAADVTPFGVACALPYPQRNGLLTHPPTLEDYVAESKTLQSVAKVILWPESAVHFDSVEERMAAFHSISRQINNGSYYAIGFEERIHSDSADDVWKIGMRRNGLVLLGWEGVVYEYYKRHLVPSELVHYTVQVYGPCLLSRTEELTV